MKPVSIVLSFPSIVKACRHFPPFLRIFFAHNFQSRKKRPDLLWLKRSLFPGADVLSSHLFCYNSAAAVQSKHSVELFFVLYQLCIVCPAVAFTEGLSGRGSANPPMLRLPPPALAEKLSRYADQTASPSSGAALPLPLHCSWPYGRVCRAP